MSKEIAQTVGGKRMVWLIAILVAFAALAMVASPWKSASADVTPANFCIDEQILANPMGPECVNTPSGGAEHPNPAPFGSLRLYKISITPLSQPTLADLQIGAFFDGAIVDVVSNLSGGSSCTFQNGVNAIGPFETAAPSVAGQMGAVLCTWDGPLATGSQGTVLVTVAATASSNPVGEDFQILDTGSAQGPVNGINQRSSYTVDAPQLSITKGASSIDQPGTGPYQTEPFVYTITATNSAAAALGVNGVRIQDTAPTGITFDSISCSAHVAPANCTLTNLANGTLLANIDIDDSAVITINAHVNANAGVFGVAPNFNQITSGTVTNTANLTCAANGTLTAGALNCNIANPNATITASGSASFLIQRVNLGAPVASALADGTDVCTIPIQNWQGNLTSLGANIVSGSGTVTVDTIAQEIRVTSNNIGNVSVNLDWVHSQAQVAWGNNTTNTVSCTFTKADFLEYEGLFHLDPWGNVLLDDEGNLKRDDENNLVGYRHTVCLADPNNVLGLDGPAQFIGIIPPATPSGFGPNELFWRIDDISSTAPPTTVQGQQMLQLWFDDAGNQHTVPPSDPVDDALVLLECVRWYSAHPGEQDVTVVNRHGEFVAGFGALDHNGLDDVVPLVKEWNLLEPTIITHRGETEPNLDGTVIEAAAGLNPLTEEFESVGLVELDEHVFGSHVQAGGETWFGLVDGALVTFTVSGTCGLAIIDPHEDTTVEMTTHVLGLGDSVTVTSAGVPINFDVDTDGCTSLTGSHTIVTITVAYPAVIGSGLGHPVPPAETIRVNWVSPTFGKKVWLAWAGQRIILEQDWSAADGSCTVDGEWVQYVKSAGTGTFDSGLGVFVNAPNEAWVRINRNHDAQNNCITRVLAENQDEGQTDWEAWIEDRPSTKVAWVIYFMKIEDVTVSLVTDVSKSSHNGSHGSARNWSPGNPWDAENDELHADWNVSKDLLVRARVRGWFTTSNPSGRPAAGSFGDNPRPADRWVMPDDWGLLVAGTLNGALAFELRPDFDYVFGPDSGIELDDPDDLIFPHDLGLIGDARVDMWDAPMPPTPITIDIRGAGFIKAVHKDEVYTNLTNPFYFADVPESPWIPAATLSGNFLWDSWGLDGTYEFWEPVIIGQSITGSPGESLSASQLLEINQIRAVYNDDTIARRLVVFSDNHGEAMVAANGDFNLHFSGCATNVFAGGKHCDTGDLVGESTLSARADYPFARGKHPPITSNVATVDWLWGGYKTVTIEPGESQQFKYVVFRALDRDGFCQVPSGSVSLHPVLTSADQAVIDAVNAGPGSHAGSAGVGAGAQLELIDFLIDAKVGGIIIDTSDGTGPIAVTQETALGVTTFNATVNSKFPPLHGGANECQAWIRLSNSLLGITDVLVVAHNDEGTLGWDNIVNFTNEHVYMLTARWSLETWVGANNIPVQDALMGTGLNEGGDDIYDEVTAIYGWVAATQSWQGFFPAGVGVPGVNTLHTLQTGQAYWIAIKGAPGHSIPWKVMTNVN